MDTQLTHDMDARCTGDVEEALCSVHLGDIEIEARLQGDKEEVLKKEKGEAARQAAKRRNGRSR